MNRLKNVRFLINDLRDLAVKEIIDDFGNIKANTPNLKKGIYFY